MSEGLRRIAVAVRVIGFVAAAVCLVGGIGLGIAAEDSRVAFVVMGAGLAAASAIVGGGLGWIIEGFAKR